MPTSISASLTVLNDPDSWRIGEALKPMVAQEDIPLIHLYCTENHVVRLGTVGFAE